MTKDKQSAEPWFEIRPSPIQGVGAFARHDISRGTRIVEYLGERITPKEADARYDEDAMENPHTFLFTVNRKVVIDAAHNGNDARFINHSCAPNCESVIEDARVFIEAIRDIPRDAELTYDYHLYRTGRYPAGWKKRYACHCGAASCRGTMLKPKRRRTKRKPIK
jgi:SET domain-containing protein